MKKEHVLSLAVVVLLALQVLSYLQIGELREQVYRAEANLNSRIGEVQNDVIGISGTIEQELAAQAAIVQDYDYQIGDFDIERKRAPVVFSITPKTLRDDTTLTLDIGGALYPMERQGNDFVVTVEIGVAQSIAPQAMVAVHSDGTTQMEALHVNLNLLETIFPLIFPHFSGQSGYQAGQFVIENGYVFLDVLEKGDNHIVALSYFLTRDGEIVAEGTQTGTEEEAHELAVVLAVDAEQGQVMDLWVETVDTQGLVQRHLVHRYVIGSEAQPDIFPTVTWGLYAPDGSTIYEEDASGEVPMRGA